MLDDNKKWMAKGYIGCTFAALFAKNPEKINWRTINIVDMNSKFKIPTDCSLLSIQFKDVNQEQVINWALNNGFYKEELEDNCVGLRYNIDNVVSWVQYFGPDAHPKTRQAPIPELCLCIKLPILTYYKVGIKGVLHLAHASIFNLTKKMADLLWESSYINTEKRLGYKPTIKEAAKTTYINAK